MRTALARPWLSGSAASPEGADGAAAAAPAEKKTGRAGCQTLLFSATLPEWVADVARRFLHPERVTVDLVGSSVMKASQAVKHLLIHCHWQERTALIADIIKARAPGDGKVIVFTETKKDAQEVSEHLQAALTSNARALHGDIPQATREKTLGDFRSGKFQVLVATDVAARGLDINGIVLVIQVEPPRDPETYIHRSGRTGRAGATGTSVTFCTPREQYQARALAPELCAEPCCAEPLLRRCGGRLPSPRGHVGARNHVHLSFAP